MKTTPCTESKSNKTYAFDLAPRCCAKTRAGTPCKSPVVRGKNRCRMHGGAKGSGAPSGNNNAFKHGLYTGLIMDEYKEIRKQLVDSKYLLKMFH